jgi:hypothetical protein
MSNRESLSDSESAGVASSFEPGVQSDTLQGKVDTH